MHLLPKKEFEKSKKTVHEREVREGLPELPGAKKGKVVMRFSPSPTGRSAEAVSPGRPGVPWESGRGGHSRRDRRKRRPSAARCRIVSRCVPEPGG